VTYEREQDPLDVVAAGSPTGESETPMVFWIRLGSRERSTRAFQHDEVITVYDAPRLKEWIISCHTLPRLFTLSLRQRAGFDS
jgi:hypothetical protein